ncbi:hypothetical protein [Halonatronum saccharophilum]|uniref:hypothetical protein n=1 Tax=Halonatronum saccharophilum TaxID=150060 RepID=UPI00048A11A1|nr:hypothetical protein [Halonatronum saccharophilum]
MSLFESNIIIILILLSYLIGHIISFLSSITIERYSIWVLGYPSNYLLDIQDENELGVFKIKKNKWIRRYIRGFNILILLPLVFIDTIIGRLFGINKLVAKNISCLQLKEGIKEKIKLFVSDNFSFDEVKEEDWFRLIYHFSSEKSPTHFSKMQNYVALFGFTRTTTFIFNICFWITLVLGFTNHINRYNMVALLILFTSLTYLMYICFNKFYRKYSLEALMAFTVINCEPFCISDKTENKSDKLILP